MSCIFVDILNLIKRLHDPLVINESNKKCNSRERDINQDFGKHTPEESKEIFTHKKDFENHVEPMERTVRLNQF